MGAVAFGCEWIYRCRHLRASKRCCSAGRGVQRLDLCTMCAPYTSGYSLFRRAGQHGSVILIPRLDLPGERGQPGVAFSVRQRLARLHLLHIFSRVEIVRIVEGEAEPFRQEFTGLREPHIAYNIKAWQVIAKLFIMNYYSHKCHEIIQQSYIMVDSTDCCYNHCFHNNFTTINFGRSVYECGRASHFFNSCCNHSPVFLLAHRQTFKF